MTYRVLTVHTDELILITTLQGRNYLLIPFADDETEAQSSRNFLKATNLVGDEARFLTLTT